MNACRPAVALDHGAGRCPQALMDNAYASRFEPNVSGELTGCLTYPGRPFRLQYWGQSARLDR